jgi:hypothetical protein
MAGPHHWSSALFTGGLWWATYRLATDAKRTAIQQATDMQSSLTIARQYSDAARDANEIAKASLQHIQRPRIIVSHRNQLLKIGEKPKVILGIHNIGSTPAYNVRSETWGAIINYPHEDFPSNAKIEDITGTIIQPQAVHDTLIDIEFPYALTQENSAHITQGTKAFCFRILVTYTDTFGNSWHTDHGIGNAKGRFWPMSGYSKSS